MKGSTSGKTAALPVVRFDAKLRGVPGTDVVAAEKPFRIFVNGAEYAAASILPGMEREFSCGFLFTSGLIESSGDILGIELSDAFDAAFVELRENPPGKRLSHSRAPLMPGTACGGEPETLTTAGLSPLETDLKLGAGSILKMVKSVKLDSLLFKETGAAHSAAIFDESGSVLARSEDVGRHNAVDKTAGFLILENSNGQAAVLVTTGRLTAEIAAKCWRLKIPILASPSCATTRAIEIANIANITLIGFARGARLTVYSAPQRVFAEE